MKNLTIAEVFIAVEKFLKTGNPGHLPPALRNEADAIRAWAVEGLVRCKGKRPPWPRDALGCPPAPGDDMGDVVRGLFGDKANEETEFAA